MRKRNITGLLFAAALVMAGSQMGVLESQARPHHGDDWEDRWEDRWDDDDDDDDNQKQATSNQNDDDDSDDFPAEWTDKGKTVSFIKAANQIREIKSEYMQYNPDEDPLSDIQ